MSRSVNKVILLGHLGQDPEIKEFSNGGRICRLRLATSETWKDRNTGERRESTQWHTVSIGSEGLVKVAEQYLSKGSQVYIEGKLETRKWQDKEGNDRYTTEVTIRGFGGQLVMLGGRGGSSGGGSRGGGGSSPSTEEVNDLDDEIPF